MADDNPRCGARGTTSRCAPPATPDRCARCGAALDPADCFVVNGTGLCRLEHIVAWVLRGGAPGGPLVVTRHRMGHELVDEFDSAEALRAWASAGGRWGG